MHKFTGLETMKPLSGYLGVNIGPKRYQKYFETCLYSINHPRFTWFIEKTLFFEQKMLHNHLKIDDCGKFCGLTWFLHLMVSFNVVGVLPASRKAL